jgi:titin
MKHHVFSPRVAAAVAVLAVFLIGGTASGAMAATPTAPGAPTGLTAAPGNGTATLSWSAPAATGGSAITGYHVYLGFSPSFTGAREFTTSGPGFRLTDAQNGSTYFIKVTALNAAGEGPATPVASVTPDPPVAPSPPTGLTAQARPGEVVLSWSPPPGGLKSGDGYLIYMGTSPGHEGAKPSFPHLIESITSVAIAPLQDGIRYYFQVARLDGNNQVSARSAEVSAVPSAGTGGGTGAGPSVSASAPGESGGGATAPPTGPSLRDKKSAQHDTSPAAPAVLIVLLAGLALTATGGAIAIVLVQRRRRGRGNAPVPAPRRPYDDQPAGPSRRIEEMNGPRYR